MREMGDKMGYVKVIDEDEKCKNQATIHLHF